METFGMGMNNDSKNIGLFGRRMLFPLLVLLLSLTFTFAATYYVASVNRAKNLARFELAIEQTENTIRDFLNSYTSILRGGAGLFAASDNVSEEEFKAFFERLRTKHFYPGVRGFGFAKRVFPEDREAQEQHMRDLGKENFKIWPEGERPEYFPVWYLEPMDWRNQRALGYDMFSESVRHAAISKAKHGLAISGKVSLVQETEHDPQSGFLIYVGAYKSKAFPETEAERDKSLIGMVYSPFRADDFFAGIFSRRNNQVHLEVYDGTNVNPAALLHRSQEPVASKPHFTATRQLHISGRTWTIVSRTTPAFEKTLDRSSVLWVLLAGLVVSGILSSVTFFLSKAWIRAENSEMRLLQERERLRSSEELHRTIAETAADAIVTINEASKIITVNHAAERIFGYSINEMIGKELTMLMPPRMRSRHTEGLSKFLVTGQKHIEWDGIELPGLHKNGNEIPLEISFGQMEKGGKRIFTGIIRDITERKRAEAEIHNLNRNLERRVLERTHELQEANHQMEAFIYSIAHDLRSPLRSMRGFAQALRDDYAAQLDDQAIDFSNRIIASAKFMDELINDLLSFSRITRTELNLGPVDITAILSEIQEQLSEDIQEKKATIQIEGALPDVIAHEATLRQVVTNLITNSLKFVAPNTMPNIRIRSEDAGQHWRIWIEDNGIGISQEYRDRIFGIFERLHGADYPGTGIGLAIVRKGVERMNGRVGVESEPNQGSRFWIELPKPSSLPLK